MEEKIKITRWQQNEIQPQKFVEQLKSEGLTAFLQTDSTGTFYPTHSHPYTEVRWIITGSMIFGVDGKEYELQAGDRLDISAGVPHYAKSSEDCNTSYLCATIQK